MQYLDRLFVLLLAVVVALLSLGLMAFSAGLVEITEAVDLLVAESLLVGIISLIAFFISARVLQISLAKKSKLKQTVITSGELGNIKITLGAIKKLVKSIIKQESEVKTIETEVEVEEEGVNISLELEVASSGSISDLAKRLQTEVQEQVSETTGAEVAEVEILIEEVERQLPSSEVVEVE